MKFFCVDSSELSGVGRPGQFSEPLISYLRRQGHEVVIGPFDADRARAADVVWTEWCYEDAFDAADSGLCKRLIIRVRGYEIWHDHLLQMPWENVSALVYESRHIEQVVAERVPNIASLVRTFTLPTGIDLSRFPFREHGHGKRVALIGRAVDLKGWQLAVEWAKQRPDLELYAVLAGADKNPRLARYLKHAAPTNVQLYPETSDVVGWMTDVGINYLLSASQWETLGYTIVEAMALGIKPLIHDRPDALQLWPADLVWSSLDDLNRLLEGPYDSAAYRAHVEASYDGELRAIEFLKIVQSLPDLPAGRDRTRLEALWSLAAQTINDGGDDQIALVEHFRKKTAPRGPLTEERYSLAVALASASLDACAVEVAEVWALRALADGPRPEPLCLLGELSAYRGDVEEAVRWYDLACTLPDDTSTMGPSDLSADRGRRRLNLRALAAPPTFSDGYVPTCYHVVIPAWNAEPWIARCVSSILAQGHQVTVTVVDDASTDGTAAAARAAGAHHVITNDRRRGALFSSIAGWRSIHGAAPGDVLAIVAGDDWLMPGALAKLDQLYAAGAWATYGGIRGSDGSVPPTMKPYPKKVIEANTYRQWPFHGGGFETYRLDLFARIRAEAFELNGEHVRVACDVARMLPILEMAGHRAFFVPGHLYTYNLDNPASLFRTAVEERMRVRDALMAKAPHARLTRI